MNKYHVRRFLNKDVGMAAMELMLEDEGGRWRDASLKLSDCARQVTIDFSYGSDKEAQKKLAKLQAMTNELIKFIDVYKAAMSTPEYNTRFKTKK